jgi:hypothetical protein
MRAAMAWIFGATIRLCLLPTGNACKPLGLSIVENNQFWDVIDSSRAKAKGDPFVQLDTLRKALLSLPPEQIVEFDRWFRRQRARAFDWGLWGAAYVIAGDCSDDGFMDFRDWLVSKGESVLDAALRDPDSLASVLAECDANGQVEGFSYVASQVWEQRTGRGALDFPYEQIVEPANPIGEPWTEDSSQLAARLPRLWQRFARI